MIRTPVCPACEKSEEETFQVLRGYIDDNPLCTMAELTDATKIPIKRITQFIRDGRLEISKGMIGEITCNKCGKPILTGRYCETCATEIGKNVNELFGKLGGDDKDGEQSRRMFTLGKSKRL